MLRYTVKIFRQFSVKEDNFRGHRIWAVPLSGTGGRPGGGLIGFSLKDAT